MLIRSRARASWPQWGFGGKAALTLELIGRKIGVHLLYLALEGPLALLRCAPGRDVGRLHC